MKLKYLLGFLVFILFSCHKEFLDKKSDKKLVVPSTLKDFQALLDYSERMNKLMPNFGEISSDDYYLEDLSYNNLYLDSYKQAYTWNKDINYYNNSSSDWEWRYEQIFYSNIVLDGLEKIQINRYNKSEHEAVKGGALFFRAWGFYQLAQLFCMPYDEESAVNDLGIPLKIESDINTPIVRATVKRTYEQILDDLQNSLELLPDISVVKTRPNKISAYAFLARVHLLMGNYELANKYSSNCLALYSTLIDYNELNPSSNYPIPRLNEEVIFHSSMLGSGGLNLAEYNLIIDSNLYSLYHENDLRKSIFFYDNGFIRYKGSYDGTADFFTGLSVSEILLIHAESNARLKNHEVARDDITYLMNNRYITGSFQMSDVSNEELLGYILQERRKELVFRGIRWSDLRRLNKEQQFKKTLQRNLNNEIFELEPNDSRYALPIPLNVIKINGIQQNSR